MNNRYKTRNEHMKYVEELPAINKMKKNVFVSWQKI